MCPLLCKDNKNYHPNQIIDVRKKAEGLKDHRQAVKCKAQNPCEAMYYQSI